MTRRDRFTPDLFTDWQPPKVAVGFDPERLTGNRLASKISRAVGLALRECGKSRAEVAKAMSDELGYGVSVEMLEKYAAEGAESHRISLERFVALVQATGCHDLLGFVAGLFDHVVVPERYASLIELHLLEEHEREIVRRRQAAEMRWRAGR